MASYYVDHTATGAADGTTKTDAYTSISNAIAGSAGVGDILLCSHTHDETQGSALTITLPTDSNVNPLTIISINFTGDAYTRGAKTGTTSGNFDLNGTRAGVEMYGLDLTTGQNFTPGANDNVSLYYDCELTLTGTAAAQGITAGGNQNCLAFKKCGFSFGGTGQGMTCSGNTPELVFEECTLLSGTSKIVTFFEGLGASATIRVDGFDFTLANDAGSFEVIGASTINQPGTLLYLHGIKLPTSGTIGDFTYTPGASPHAGVRVTAIDDATDDVFIRTAGGDIEDDLVVYRDATTDGSTGYSLKFTSDSGALPGSHVPSNALMFDIATFYSAANPTVTVHAFGNHATILTDQEFWIEVEYPISTGLRGFSSTVHSELVTGTGSSVTATGSAGDWTGESGSNQRFYNPSVTVSGGSAGIHRVRAYLTRASETLYVDPKVDLT